MAKKELLIFILITYMLVSLQQSAAISSDMQQSYLSSQTVVTKLSGNILQPITAAQVEFKKNNVRIAPEYDIKKLGDDYYLWFISPVVQNETNYTIFIHNITTTYLGAVQNIDFNQSFSVKPLLSEYYIKPGFVYTSSNFNVQLVLNNDYAQEIAVNFPSAKSYTIEPGINNIPFLIKDAREGTGLYMIQIGEYLFPAYLINGPAAAKKTNYIVIQPAYIHSKKLLSDNSIYYQIQVSNLGTNNVTNLALQYGSGLFTLVPDENISLAPGESQTYQITLNSPSRQNINDTFYFISSDNNISEPMPFSIMFFEKLSDINQTFLNISNLTADETSLYSCSELLGQICSSNQICSGDSLPSSDGICCTAICANSSDNSGSGSYSWIGYLIAAIVIIGLLILYAKYKKVKPESNPIGKSIEDSEKSKKIMP